MKKLATDPGCCKICGKLPGPEGGDEYIKISKMRRTVYNPEGISTVKGFNLICVECFIEAAGEEWVPEDNTMKTHNLTWEEMGMISAGNGADAANRIQQRLGCSWHEVSEIIEEFQQDCLKV